MVTLAYLLKKKQDEKAVLSLKEKIICSITFPYDSVISFSKCLERKNITDTYIDQRKMLLFAMHLECLSSFRNCFCIVKPWRFRSFPYNFFKEIQWNYWVTMLPTFHSRKQKYFLKIYAVNNSNKCRTKFL